MEHEEQPPLESSDDPKPPEEPPQMTIITNPTPRSYECNFCKRGFTNAQALGGHMNIHRKDKAKFKHSTTSNTTIESPSNTRPRLLSSTTTNSFSISNQGNWLSTPTQGVGENVVPLIPLLGHHDTGAPTNVHQPPLPDREVDLELRLGHVEPEPESSVENKTTTTTRKFF